MQNVLKTNRPEALPFVSRREQELAIVRDHLDRIEVRAGDEYPTLVAYPAFHSASQVERLEVALSQRARKAYLDLLRIIEEDTVSDLNKLGVETSPAMASKSYFDISELPAAIAGP